MVKGKEDNVSLDRLKPAYLLKESYPEVMTGASNQGSSRTCNHPRPVPRKSISRNPKGLVEFILFILYSVCMGHHERTALLFIL
ncbi:hypothetical protein LAZ67_11000419 [Cordylochernes scorpioides]|uniref:Uncharacterized protein n=1 Tax=Cordylochernes scorpioides TaxID=51811 RepID=A0ABY6L048_9ARAC|nr:hypothetical protein LAZ67_11000419 [Cordylochernes scorpioides]